MEDEETFGLWEGQCQACDVWGPVNDLMLCEECDVKIQRDLIRARDWDYVAAALLQRQERFVRWMQEHPGEPLTDKDIAEDLLTLGRFRFGWTNR